MKDINISDGIFIPSPGSCPRGRTCGYCGGGGGGGGDWGVKKNFPEIQPDLACEFLTSMAHAMAHFLGPHPLGPWEGAKRSNIIKSQSQSQFQRFLNQTLCVFSQMKDIKNIRRDFHSIAWVMPQGWDLGVSRGGGGVGGQKTFPPNSTRFGV